MRKVKHYEETEVLFVELRGGVLFCKTVGGALISVRCSPQVQIFYDYTPNNTVNKFDLTSFDLFFKLFVRSNSKFSEKLKSIFTVGTKSDDYVIH